MAIPQIHSLEKNPSIFQCDAKEHGKHTLVADLDGTLLIDRSSFLYFALVAFDVGGILRLLMLLLASPLAWMLNHFVSESAGIRVLVFTTFAGVKVSAIKSAARLVLPRHYSDDLHPETWRVFSSCEKKCVLTVYPRIMVEPFLKEYLGVDVVLGTEIGSYKGIATGLVAGLGVLVGENKAVALRLAFDEESTPHIGIGNRESDLPFMRLCKEGYIVPSKSGVRPVRQEALPRPVIFHDGRLVQKPTPLMAVLIILWFPIAVPLSILRVLVGSFFPISISYYIIPLLGAPVTVKGAPLQLGKRTPGSRGLVFVCGSHKNNLDPLYVSGLLGGKGTILTYMLPRLAQLLSPVRTQALKRDRATDAKIIDGILSQGRDVIMCPEGTSCREPYMLRFSALFAELTDQIVPVAVSLKTSMFHGTTVRGYKWLDPFFFMMNPLPAYEITFLNKLPLEETCRGGKSCREVANHVQKLIGATLNYKCTNLTRKDKYQTMVGTDGLAGQKPLYGASKKKHG